MKSLNLLHCRRWIITGNNLTKKNEQHEGKIGLYFNASENDVLKRLFLWDSLEELWINNNYIEGHLPNFTADDEGVELWMSNDSVIVLGGDTLKNLVGRPKIMPNMKSLKINLNFFTGELPEWLLKHPRLLDWFPESLIYPQQDKGIDSNGDPVGFSNVPTNYEYYFDFFPGYREKYEIKEERE